MLWNWIAWRTIRLSLLVSTFLTLSFFIVQLVKLDKLIFKLPVFDAVSFMFLWWSYFFVYFIPSSLLLSWCWSLYELKENKKLHVMQTFGISLGNVLFHTLLRLSPLLLAMAVGAYLLHQSDISTARNILLSKYYSKLLMGVPAGDFYTAGNVTFYVGEREGNTWKNVFLKTQDLTVVAKEAVLHSDGILLKHGSVLTEKENKRFLARFDVYLLRLGTPPGTISKTTTKDMLVNFINLFFSIALIPVVSPLVLGLIRTHTQLYYLVGLISIFYHLTILLIRSSLTFS